MTDTTKSDERVSHGKRIQDAFKNKTEKIRSTFKTMKKPQFRSPNFNKFKIPDQMRVNLPSFHSSKKITTQETTTTIKTPSVKERQFSTESNVSETKRKIFNFKTYPRIFKKKAKVGDELGDEDVERPVVESATVPRVKKTSIGSRWAQTITSLKNREESKKDPESKRKSPDTIRIPLHSEESMDREENDLSRHPYEEDIDEEYTRENEESGRASPFSSDLFRNRWNHGSFHGENLHEIESDMKITDLDNDMEPEESPQEIERSDIKSSSSFGDVHRRGVLEEINQDEFFLRMKGYSQDDIEMGAYLSSEIREAFRQPVNALSRMQDEDFDASDRSLQEPPKKKPIKKPKRKKTPHVSHEKISNESNTEPEEYPREEFLPPRPKRKGKGKKREKDVIPYQETIPIDLEHVNQTKVFQPIRQTSSDVVVSDQTTEDDPRFYFREEYPQMYENEHMLGIDQPNILISDPYQMSLFLDTNDERNDELGYENERPEAPARKQKSLKSLSSEHDSITEEIIHARGIVPTDENVSNFFVYVGDSMNFSFMHNKEMLHSR